MKIAPQQFMDEIHFRQEEVTKLRE
jgi:hypothetical protein